MSAVRISLPSRNKIPLPATSISTMQLCPGDDRSHTYISKRCLGSPIGRALAESLTSVFPHYGSVFLPSIYYEGQRLSEINNAQKGIMMVPGILSISCRLFPPQRANFGIVCLKPTKAACNYMHHCREVRSCSTLPEHARADKSIHDLMTASAMQYYTDVDTAVCCSMLILPSSGRSMAPILFPISY